MQEQGKAGLFVIWVATNQAATVGMRINDAIQQEGDPSGATRSMYYELYPTDQRDLYNELTLVAGAMTGYDEIAEPVRVVVDKLVFYDLEGATRTYWSAAGEVDLLKVENEQEMRIQIANGKIQGKNDDERWGQFWDQNEEAMRDYQAAVELKGKARAEMEVAKARVRLLAYMQHAVLPDDVFVGETEDKPL